VRTKIDTLGEILGKALPEHDALRLMVELYWPRLALASRRRVAPLAGAQGGQTVIPAARLEVQTIGVPYEPTALANPTSPKPGSRGGRRVREGERAVTSQKGCQSCQPSE